MAELWQIGRLTAVGGCGTSSTSRELTAPGKTREALCIREIEVAIRDAAKRERTHSEKRATEERPAADGMMDFATAPTWDRVAGKTAQQVGPDFRGWYGSDAGDAVHHAVTTQPPSYVTVSGRFSSVDRCSRNRRLRQPIL